MLKAMRHHAKYFYVLFFIVILSFIFWGVGTVDKSDGSRVVAEVGKYKITGEEYWRTYDRMFNFYRDMYKEKFDQEMQKKLNLKEGVLNSLVDNRVLLIAAKEGGITVSDEELNEAIKNEQAFMKDGSFDSAIYQNRLRLMRLTPEAYEAAKRQDLILTKMRRLIELSTAIPADELAKISGPDEQTTKALQDAMVQNARATALRAYVEGVKKGMKIKLYPDRIA
ncbi:MAG TPA: SurA N-terminal domain-containing protein [Candidatus Sulfobium mesophilum]|nr:SurA N-terminal domain-containing protein [Candidatus Sulfobium mesophilum]